MCIRDSACIVALSLYPGLILSRTNSASADTVFATKCRVFLEPVDDDFDSSSVPGDCDELIEQLPVSEVQVIK